MSGGPAFDWRVYRGVAIAFLAAKLALLIFAHPFMDETYYWLWGQHLALGYYDHPPLIGWTQAVASLLGWNIISLRLFVFLTIIGDLALLYGFARHLAGGAWRESFWASAALFAATPIFFGLTNLAMPDHLLVFFTLAALYCVTRFNAGWQVGEPRWRFLYLAAIAVGFATLSKYSGALLAAVFVIFLAASPKMRGVFRSPHLYLAALIALAMQAPVLIWNAQHDWVSFGYILGGRRLGQGGNFHIAGLTGYFLGFLLVLSPFLLWPLARFAVARGDGNGLPRLIFWVSTVCLLVASFVTDILIHWNIIAYAAMLPFLAPWLRSRALAVGHFAFGALVAAALTVNYAVVPLVTLYRNTDESTALSYGWEEVVPAVESARAEYEPGFIATPWYASAGALAFALHDPNVISLGPRRDTFDDWFDPAAHAGLDALLVSDRRRGIPDNIRVLFKSVDVVKEVEVVRFGYLVERYSIYIARAYAPSSQ